jgi:MYXO-CTERM domain-containing protein
VSGVAPALVAGDVVTARARAPGRALSDPSSPVVVLGKTATPVVSAPLVEGDTAISGTSPNGGIVEVFVDAASLGPAAVTGTAWTLTGVAALVAGQSVTAVATAAPLGRSDPSPPVVVLRRSAAPQVSAPLGDGDRRVSGTSAEPDGTVIIVFVDGIPVASATVQGGRWSADVPALAQGSSVTATAQAPGAAASRPSEPVVVLRRTQTPTVDTPIATGATQVSGTSDEPPGTEIEVRVDGQPVGTATVGEDGTWSVQVPPLGQGQEVTVVATAEGAAPSVPSSPVVVGGADGGVPPRPSLPVSGGAFTCASAGGGGSWSLLLLLAVVALVWARRRRGSARAP